MPANPKYLTTSKWQRFTKVSASILGGFLLAASFHLAIAAWSTNQKTVFITYSFTLFILWVALMFIPYLSENGWKCWLWYGAFIIIFSVITYLGATYHSIT